VLPVSVISGEKPFIVIFTVKAAIMQQKKVRHVKLSLQKDEASSIEKSRPPTGAPKAAEIPVVHEKRKGYKYYKRGGMITSSSPAANEISLISIISEPRDQQETRIEPWGAVFRVVLCLAHPSANHGANMNHRPYGFIIDTRKLRAHHGEVGMLPSGPNARPEEYAKISDSTLPRKVLMLMVCSTRTPFRYPITSGIPLPAAGACARLNVNTNCALALKMA